MSDDLEKVLEYVQQRGLYTINLGVFLHERFSSHRAKAYKDQPMGLTQKVNFLAAATPYEKWIGGIEPTEIEYSRTVTSVDETYLKNFLTPFSSAQYDILCSGNWCNTFCALGSFKINDKNKTKFNQSIQINIAH